MIRRIFIALSMCILFPAIIHASEIIEIKAHDNEIIVGKLDLPKGENPVKAIVIYIPGTGPFAYERRVKIGNRTIDYFDLFAEQFNKLGVAFFRYNTRGTQISDQPPTYDKVDIKKFKENIPSNQVQDLESIISGLKKRISRISQSKTLLLGWSEGTIIASIVADRKRVNVEGLLLAGYANDTVFNIMKWQFSGVSSMIFYRKHFDKNNDGAISKEEFEKDHNNIRSSVLKNVAFVHIDKNSDGKLTQEDFALLLKDRADKVFKAIENEDDDWIWKNYFRITSKWLKAHSKLEPNEDRLLRLNLPIHIFHGNEDASAPIQGVFDIQKRFNTKKKKNLTVYIFKQHDHDLNYLHYAYNGIISDGLKAIFATVKVMNKE